MLMKIINFIIIAGIVYGLFVISGSDVGAMFTMIFNKVWSLIQMVGTWISSIEPIREFLLN